MSTATHHNVELRYATESDVEAASDASRVLLALEGSRGTVGVRGKVREPALFRDALAATLGILASDLRYRGKDRTAYLAYLMKQGKRATAQIWEAQKAFLDEALQGEEKKDAVLDPVLTVDPDQVSLEVFSRDESAYARLTLDNSLFEGREAAHGSTFLDVPPKLLARVDRLRTYVPVSLEAHVALPPASPEPRAPRAVEVPHAWLRGFLQVQSAATLPHSTCTLAPIDLYNLLFALRTRKAKKAPRALRFELVPGAPPRLVLEPWETVLECHGPAYTGAAPAVVRTFGRQRLAALARLLPHARHVRVELMGPGLPVFWVVDMGPATLTLALTGWTESGWSSAAAFDALMPRAVPPGLAEKLRQRLRQEGPLSFDALRSGVDGAAKDAVRAALQLECLRGRVLYDIATERYRPRELLATPVDEAVIRYGDEREARAHRLLEGAGEVKLTKVHDVVGEGTRIHGEVVDREAVRSFFPSFLLDSEGRVREASCGCPHFRRSGMREGPCEHMLALRLAYSRRRAEEEAQRQSAEGRGLIRAETRSYVRRDASGKEQVYRVSLDGKVVAVEWGPRLGEPRHQRLWFDSDAEARAAYFARLAQLTSEGYIDSAAPLV